jgi:hypothetical protein
MLENKKIIRVMATAAIIQLLPNLYSIQKKLESYATTFGARQLYLDPEDDSDKSAKLPSKGKNVNTLTDIANELVTYGNIRLSIEAIRLEYNTLAWIYCTIVIVLLIVPYMSIMGILTMQATNGVGGAMYDFLKKFKFVGILMIIIATIIITWGLYCSIMITITNVKINNKLSQKSSLETKQVAKVIQMFNVTGVGENGEALDVNSNYPSMMYYFKQNNPNKVINWNDMPENCTDINETANVSLSTFLSNCKDRLYDNKLFYPFVSNKTPEIDPFLLKKQLQKSDMYEQLNRLQQSTNVIKQFFWRATDEKYKTDTNMTDAARQELDKQITDIILSSVTVVKNIVALGDGSNISEQDCFAAAINNTSAVGVSYDPKTKKCMVIPNNAIVQFVPEGDVLTLIKAVPSTLSITCNIQPKAIGPIIMKSSTCSKDTDGCIFNTRQSTNSYIIASSTNPSYKTFITAGEGYQYNTTGNNIVKTESVLLSLQILKDWYVQKIIDHINTVDVAGKYLMTQDDINTIMDSIKNNDSEEKEGILKAVSDILADVPTYLAQQRAAATDNTENEMKSFIPYDRFLEKVGAMDSKAFIVEFVHNLEEIRSCSDGLNILNETYPVIELKMNNNRKLINASLGAMAVVGITGLIAYGIYKYDNEFGNLHDATDMGVCDSLVQNELHKEKNEAPEPNDPNVIAPTPKMERYIKYALEMTMIIALVVTVMVIFKSTYVKQLSIDNFNQQVLISNGATLVNSSREIIETIYSNHKDDAFGILNKTDKQFSNVNALKNLNITIDPFQDDSLGDCATDSMFESIVKNSIIDSNVQLKIGQNNNLYDVYLATLNILVAFDKCNKIFTLGNQGMPFPLLEMFVYIVIFVICVLCAFMIFSHYDIAESVRMLPHYLQHQNIHSARSLVVYKEPSTKAKENAQKRGLYLQIIAIIFMWVFTGIFCNVIYYDARSFISSLYASGMFQAKQCY